MLCNLLKEMSHNCILLKNMECRQLWQGRSPRRKLGKIGKIRQFCYFLLGESESVPPQLCDDGFKKYEFECKFLQSETLISHSILFLEQLKLMATGT